MRVYVCDFVLGTLQDIFVIRVRLSMHVYERARVSVRMFAYGRAYGRAHACGAAASRILHAVDHSTLYLTEGRSSAAAQRGYRLSQPQAVHGTEPSSSQMLRHSQNSGIPAALRRHTPQRHGPQNTPGGRFDGSG
jgi:hypothetical protein